MSNLPSSNIIPAVLTNARVYKDGQAQLGVATAELPDLEYMTESMSGLGIAGEVDMPVQGHFKSMTLKLKWNTTTADAIKLLEMESHHLDIRGNIQKHDAGTGKFVDEAIKVLVRATPKKVGVGKFEPGKKMDPETELEITYFKLWQGGKELVELDKLNFIFRVLGVDKMSQIRANLGMN